MASVVSDPNGRKRVQFVAPDGSRKTVRLGKVDRRTAEGVCRHVEALLAARISGQPVPRETAVWLAGVGEGLLEKLRAVGLVETNRPKVPTLVELVETYRSARTDVKPGTAVNLGQAAKNLVAYFGPDRRIDQVTEADAEDYYRHLLATGKAHNTARRLTGRAKQFFSYAVRARLLSHNPFAGLKTATGGNPQRQEYVSIETARRVIEACPSAEWRLIVALCRFAGLRCPSEHLALTWGDVLWDRGRFVVRSSKTEHHEGKGQRIVPIFPELRPYLEEAFELAEPGSVYVIGRNRLSGRKDGMLNGINVNWRTQLLRILRRAGVRPWPRLFHALRASCQTDLAGRFPAHVVCDWLGNSLAVAREHYLQVTDDHYEQAVQGGVKSGAREAQNPTQQEAAYSRKETQVSAELAEPQGNERLLASPCEVVQGCTVTLRGLEQSLNSAENSAFLVSGGAKSDARDAAWVELAGIWSRLKPGQRRELLACAQRLLGGDRP